MPEYHFDKEKPHSKGEPTIREPAGLDASDMLKGPSAGDKVSAITKLKK
jgi:hypothetical protein